MAKNRIFKVVEIDHLKEDTVQKRFNGTFDEVANCDFINKSGGMLWQKVWN